MRLQAKLLRVLTASLLNLQEAVRLERFRLDLYHRINVVRIELPPLRDRIEDIAVLTRSFLERLSREMERDPVEVTPEAMEVLACYPWPGNVRELQNAMKRTLALCNHSLISVEDLPDDIVTRAGNLPGGSGGGFFVQRERRLAAFEKEYFRNLLAACQGDVALAASEARLPRGTLYRLMKKHALSATEFRTRADFVEERGTPS